jgi:hypothetical protein
MAFRDRALPVNVKLFFLDGTLSVFFDLHRQSAQAQSAQATLCRA